MRIDPFRMERWQSTWEHRVRFNLSESGVHPMTPRELLQLTDGALEDLLDVELGYNQSNGSDELRGLVASLYSGADVGNVLVTNGGAEANFVTAWALLEPGDTVVMEVPNYMQMWGLAAAFSGDVRRFALREEDGWAPDLDELRERVADGARAIIVTNPNNPTGAILTEDEMSAIVEIADRVGAWIIADEIYTGAELDGPRTPSFWGRYDRVIVTGGLSKAYGLPGLRIGWVVAPADLIDRLWPHKDYTTIAPGTISDRLACLALRDDARRRIQERTRRILNDNLPPLVDWLGRRPDTFRFVSPRAGAICYVRYELEIESTELARRLKAEQDLLIVPGDHFEMDGYLRLGYGLPQDELLQALDRIEGLIRSLE